MLHYEESHENLNIIWQPPFSRQTPPISPYQPFLAKMFRPPPPPAPISITFGKVEPIL